MRRTLKLTLGLASAVLIAVALTACTDDKSNSQNKERDTQQSNYDGLVAQQPAGSMQYSPTRETINFWIDTWDQPDKLSYVYLLAGDGTYLGYYILKGLPVSYCASLTPPYRWEDIPGDGGNTDTQVPAPAMDGVYYSGAQCNTYYGVDATTGAYVEYTAGMGINVLLYDQPLPLQEQIQPLGRTTFDDVEE